MTPESCGESRSERRVDGRLRERLSRCLGAATWEMDTFCRLAGVESSRAIETAAVTCEGRPRMLLNPDFVAQHCARDEHLFLLAMHELWHVLLAHTRLYPRATPAENVAFDAVINAGLARQFPGVAYRGFFEELNPADSFPGLLLRPPPGWPAAPRYPDRDSPRGVRRLLRALYPPPAPDWPPMPTYDEILRLLRRAGRATGAGEAFLLGAHDDEGQESESRALSDAVLGSIVRRIVGRWPPPPFRISGRDDGGDARAWLVSPGDVRLSARTVFAGLLRRLLVPGAGGSCERRRQSVDVTAGLGVLPNPRDRLATARRRLGLPGTLWAQELPRPLRVSVSSTPAHIYLDVSGSMGAVLPPLLDLLIPHVAQRRARVFQFSTEVHPLTLDDLAAGRLCSTWGTKIDPVLRHALEVPRVSRVVLVTDGYTGTPRKQLVADVTARGLAVHVVLPSEGAWSQDLASVARSITVLPPVAAPPTR